MLTDVNLGASDVERSAIERGAFRESIYGRLRAGVWERMRPGDVRRQRAVVNDPA